MGDTSTAAAVAEHDSDCPARARTGDPATSTIVGPFAIRSSREGIGYPC